MLEFALELLDSIFGFEATLFTFRLLLDIGSLLFAADNLTPPLFLVFGVDEELVGVLLFVVRRGFGGANSLLLVFADAKKLTEKASAFLGTETKLN